MVLFILHISTILDVRKTKKMDMVMEIIGFFYMHSMNSYHRIDVGEIVIVKIKENNPPPTHIHTSSGSSVL